MSVDLVNIIFGMKVRQARVDAGLTLSKLASLCDLSASYLTEIEKGRKYPRADKIMKMAEVLGKDYDDLVSIKLPPSLAYLETALSSSMLRHFPFNEFGFEAGDLIHLLTREPDKVSALMHAVLQLSRTYDLKEEDFLRATLRSYQEINENYFQEIEDAVGEFVAAFSPTYQLQDGVTQDVLEKLLEETYHYEIDYDVISETEVLNKYRSIFVPGHRPKLFVNGHLYECQQKFVLARELGYQYLGLKERSLASTPDRINSFDQLLNDYKAAYFGGALLLPRTAVIADLEAFFALPNWRPQPLQAMLKKYNVSPETLLYRFSELIPEFFGLKMHFLRCFQENGRIRLNKQLNMNRLLIPSGLALMEHYCRRWLSVRLLTDLTKQNKGTVEAPLVGVQYSEFLESPGQFLCIGFSRPLILNPSIRSSVLVGFRVDNDLKSTIQFLDDPAISHQLIHETCERCPLTPEQCQLRAAPPTIWQAAQLERERKLALSKLAEDGR